MKILTYNINGIRAVLKKDFLSWLKSANPDVLCLQELKAWQDQFDSGIFTDLGYELYIEPADKKGYSGVGILSKAKPNHVEYGIGIEKYDSEGRMIRLDFDQLSVISVYMPSGASKVERQIFKLEWLQDFYKYISNLKKEIPNLVIGGDFNLCHQAIDIHDPIRLDGYPGFTPEERAWMTDFLDLGFVDSFRTLNPEPYNYSWWSYRSGARVKNLGWRIDYLILASEMKEMLKNARHLDQAKHSDHCPVLMELSL